jgi:lipopolysaccharide/colanic/teichoic acid biosynthesis glycosyltransferase
VLDDRSRTSDELGWFDEDTICAILPETAGAGARCFAGDILDLAHKMHVFPFVTVYEYDASKHPPHGNRNGRSPDSTITVLATRRALAASRSTFVNTTESQRVYDVRRMETLLWMPPAFAKRAVDVLGAALALLMFAPLMLVIAGIIKCSEPKGSVFFRQRRAGLGGRAFTMFKFRTMCMDAEARKDELRSMSEQDGPAFKLQNDPRVTPIGRFLRKTSLDELPQLLNVLSGDMSLVGPRPPTFDEVAQYKQWYLRRLTVMPGITCLWQVEGRSSVTFEQWMRMDARYVRRKGFWLDLKLIARTIPAVLLRRGAC